MAKYILVISYIKDADNTIHVPNAQKLQERIASLKQSDSVTKIQVFSCTSIHSIAPTWIEATCAP